MARLLLAALTLATLLATRARAQGAAECNCTAIRLSPTDVPVRDKDGVMYANLCLAQCQHADIDTSSVSAAAAAGPAPRARAGTSSAAPAGGKLHAARITNTGLLYLQPKSAAGAAGGGPVAGAAAVPAGPQPTAGFRGALPDPPAGADPGSNATGGAAGRQQASRKLLQPVGTDDRWQITSPTAHAFPWRAVGYIDSGCSGSLVGPSTVLTAGHCVYDTGSGTFFSNLRFTPDMHDGGQHCARHRGSACVAWDTPTSVPWAKCDDGSLLCQTKQDIAWDLALITLERAAGTQFGCLGFGYTCESQTYAVTSAGYPADLDSTMTHMYATAGTLDPFSGCLAESDPAGVVSSDLDAAVGQSGSPIWENTSEGYFVRATHNADGPWHRTIVKRYYEWILQNLK
ncbi:hypothetical protein ABPG75_009902 [Micractinium tetrahymenae]